MGSGAGTWGKQLLGGTLFDNAPFFHKYNFGSQRLGKIHLVGSQQHGHAARRKLANNRYNLAYDAAHADCAGRLAAVRRLNPADGAEQ